MADWSAGRPAAAGDDLHSHSALSIGECRPDSSLISPHSSAALWRTARSVHWTTSDQPKQCFMLGRRMEIIKNKLEVWKWIALMDLLRYWLEMFDQLAPWLDQSEVNLY